MYQKIRVDEHTWAFEKIMPDGDVVRFFVLDGSEKCLVLDSGFMAVDVQGLEKELLQEEGRAKTPAGHDKEILLANTHGDMDHTGGNGSFESFYITDADYEIMQLKEKFPGISHLPAEEGTRIELGNRTLVYYLVPGHTLGNAMLLDVTDRTLYTGDIVQTGTIFMFGAHRRPDQMLPSLRKVQSMKGEFDRIYACHGKMILEPDAVDETIRAWEMVLNREVEPVRTKVFGNVEVDLYRCGFCNFFCGPEK